MANVYVYSGAAGAGTGADWTNAYTTLSAALTAKAAGDVFFVADDHNESTAASVTFTSPGTEANPCKVLCVRRTGGSVPPVSADLRTTGIITTTGASSIVLAGSLAEVYGLVLNCGTGNVTASLIVSNTSNRTVRLKSCALKLVATGSACRISLGNAKAACGIIENCTMQFSNTNQSAQSAARGFWLGGSVVLGSVPGELIRFTDNAFLFVEGVDLSNIDALDRGSDVFSGNLVFKDCKLKSGAAAYLNLPVSFGGVQVTLLRSDSGDTNYRLEYNTYGLAQTTETTIVRSGGASDGVTPISWKLVTTGGGLTYRSLPISVWNDTISSTAVTVTLQGLLGGGGAIPVNSDIWIEVTYLGTSGFPISSKVSSGVADALATGSSYSAGSGTWGGSGTKFEMAVTFTPQEKGPFNIAVCVAKSSSATYYIDPKPIIT